jgi:hypothetical protein
MADCWYCVELGVPPEPEARRGLCEAHASLQEVHGAVALFRSRRELDPVPEPAAAERGERIWRAERDLAGAKLLHRQALARVEREAQATDYGAADRLLAALDEQDRSQARLDAAIQALAEARA